MIGDPLLPNLVVGRSILERAMRLSATACCNFTSSIRIMQQNVDKSTLSSLQHIGRIASRTVLSVPAGEPWSRAG